MKNTRTQIPAWRRNLRMRPPKPALGNGRLQRQVRRAFLVHGDPATSHPMPANGVRGSDLTIFPGIWAQSSRRLLLSAEYRTSYAAVNGGIGRSSAMSRNISWNICLGWRPRPSERKHGGHG